MTCKNVTSPAMIPTLAQLLSAGFTLIEYVILFPWVSPSALSISERPCFLPFSCKNRPYVATSRTSAVSHIDIWSLKFPWEEVLDLLWLKKHWNFHIIPSLERGYGVEDLTSKASALKLNSHSPACARLLIPEIAGSAIHIDTFNESTEHCDTFLLAELAVLEVPVRGTLSSPAETLITVRRKQSSKMPVTRSCLSILQQRTRDQAALGF